MKTFHEASHDQKRKKKKRVLQAKLAFLCSFVTSDVFIQKHRLSMYSSHLVSQFGGFSENTQECDKL